MTYGERIHAMALEALSRYNEEVQAGANPRYPAWIRPILATRRPPLMVCHSRPEATAA